MAITESKALWLGAAVVAVVLARFAVGQQLARAEPSSGKRAGSAR